jgi:hypothetical protein
MARVRPPKNRPVGRNETAGKLLPGRFARFLSRSQFGKE